ncbi:MAG: hypothetical protein AVDCRST_MAG27-964, partial [uncultured Craurococcus sp.]
AAGRPPEPFGYYSSPCARGASLREARRMRPGGRPDHDPQAGDHGL